MPSQVGFIQHKFDHYSIHENLSKEALNHHKLCEITIRIKKKAFWPALPVFFAVELFLEFL